MGQKRALSNVDTAWLHMEDPTNLMMVTGILVFENPLDFEVVTRVFSHRFLRFDCFRQRVVEPKFGMGTPYWEEDPHFELSSHLHCIALPAPGDQKTLQRLVGDLMSTPLDFSKPLWHFHLIENYGTGCALLGRIHHCIADGIALIQVILSMTDASAETSFVFSEEEAPAPAEKEPRWNPFKNLLKPATSAFRLTKRLTEIVLHEGMEILQHPSHTLELAKLAANTVQALGKLVLLPPDSKSLFKGALGVSKRVAWSTPISLATIKAIGKQASCTVNDVLVTVATGALRRYLKKRDALGDLLNFRAVVPVNLREVPIESELGNYFGLIFLSLPVGLKDPKERLLEIKRRMDEIKKSPEAVVAFGILQTLGIVHSEIENIVLNIFGAKATLVMTNVPGPREPIYFAGNRVKQIMGWVPQAGHLGLGLSIISYAGEVILGVAVDAHLVPHPDEILEGFYEEFDVLRQLFSE